MPDFFKAEYQQTGLSKKTDDQGMREMQQIAFKANSAQYLLIKAPPASGKSRALMFIALEKLQNQGIKKVIVAVPERNIGASFKATALSKEGFFADWTPNPHYNLCTSGSEKSKVSAFLEFLDSDEKILICTHATFRFACDELDAKQFNDCLIAIDEFHHVSADGDNRLGEVMKNIMAKSNAHIVAMTGSYFRGDNVPVLLPEDEIKFTKVTYNYYQQLNGYEYLKSLGIGYHFYTGRYFKKPFDKDISALAEILDVTKKTIIHIPNVNANESSKDKMAEVGHIIDVLGDVDYQDPDTGVIYVKDAQTGKTLKIADLVNDELKEREKISTYLRTHAMDDMDAIDIIIALGMAKEGFDWPFCEHALTIGYRGSLTEIIQIIGRATRDSSNKTHAQFTNLIAEPNAEGTEVKIAVNNMLKAITASLLMEQVLAPNFNFKLKSEDENEAENDKKNDDENTIRVRGFKTPTSQRAKDIIEQDLNDLKAKILQDNTMLKAMPGNVEPEVINKVLIPKIIKEIYPDLNDEEVETVRQHVVLDSVVKNGEIVEQADKKFIRMANSFVNIDDIHIDLIDQINPFQKAFEILSKAITTKTLKLIDDHIQSIKVEMTEEEALLLWPKIVEYRERTGELPNLQSFDPKEKRMAEAIVFLRELKRKRQMDEN
ncbi:DEAD/DEAH box helicase [Moraxella catarrhalis]|uniref:DNA helicase, restriction/modification system component YeeB n=1 Tax=Moraxella catarrhalis TaxID=480 RepID=A0AB36DQ92_MORCA|nr:DEAD/DEAH box helicase family protein [Moraxella catarrhalis]MPX29260.1 ATP-dependent helicase [Moraxella catarrhalis]OAV26752.1 DNA helicase, restriction/modification system component YeeB [Moraxella catarrhalis]RKL86260.1 ATP-dependent helicase [Moraxella catarrhalis]RKL87928.1 ATP-dependent helicase [Moraxella catarrhalis]RKL98526.1 ATP-dependent helicase [Moraxella catarrhalis]